MSKKIEQVKSSLEIEEDLALHETGWIIQRIGWALMLVFLVCALLGLFGNGTLSETKLSAEGTTVRYNKYLRSESDTELEIVTNDVRGEIRVELSPDFIKLYKLDRLVPQPSSQKIQDGYTILEFSANGRANLAFFLTTREGVRGSVTNTLAINNTQFTLSHFIYPSPYEPCFARSCDICIYPDSFPDHGEEKPVRVYDV